MNALIFDSKRGELSAIGKIVIWMLILILLVGGVYWIFGRITS